MPIRPTAIALFSCQSFKSPAALTAIAAIAAAPMLLFGCQSASKGTITGQLPASSTPATPTRPLDSAPNLIDVTNEMPIDLTRIVSEKPYTALHFLLKTECPLCIRHTRSYHRGADEVPQTTQIFIKPDSLEEIRHWAEQAGEDGPVFYQDANAELARYLDIPDGYAFHGESVHYPALIVLDQEGQEVFRYIGRNNSDRYPLNRFRALIADLETDANAE